MYVVGLFLFVLLVSYSVGSPVPVPGSSSLVYSPVSVSGSSCFADCQVAGSQGPRALGVWLSDAQTETPDSCAWLASNRNLPYFGLQYGDNNKQPNNKKTTEQQPTHNKHNKRNKSQRGEWNREGTGTGNSMDVRGRTEGEDVDGAFHWQVSVPVSVFRCCSHVCLLW